MSTIQDDVLLLALANNELDKFLVGEPLYFLEAKHDNDEPQNVVAAFDQLLVPYWRETRDACLPERFVDALLAILSTYHDRNRAIYIAHDWVWYYRFCLNKKRGKPDSLYTALFEVDMSSVASALKQQLEINKTNLIADTRWAGAAWNSHNGMWGPLMLTALMVRDRLDGPNFVPANI